MFLSFGQRLGVELAGFLGGVRFLIEEVLMVVEPE